MSLINLPDIQVPNDVARIRFEARQDAVARWLPTVQAAPEPDQNITIYDRIGTHDGGVTVRRIGGALRALGAQDVTVKINSPGGDFFEGIGIYNLLRQHQAKVTVQVMGEAASAASVIAMAGDEILMGPGSFLMIHNAWAVAVGNRHDMQAAGELLLSFDQAMAAIYAARSGYSIDEAALMMDTETWLNAEQAVASGFATGLLDEQASSEAEYGRRQALAQTGMNEVAARLHTLITTIRSES